MYFNKNYKSSLEYVKNLFEEEKNDFDRQRLENKITCLETYKREICSNRLLPRKDLIECDEKLLEFKNHINNISKNEFNKLVIEMDEKYKFISDYDFFGSKYFVNIKDFREQIIIEYGIEKFKEKYLDLGKEIVLIDKYCHYNDIFGVKMNDIDIEFIKQQFKKEEGDEFYISLKKGLEHYYKNSKSSDSSFEDEIIKFEFHLVENSPCYGYKITLKEGNEYGIVELCNVDDKDWTIFYRTDENFENRELVGNEHE